MPARYADDLRHRAIVMWISGYTVEAIADKLGISIGSVRNIIHELRERRYPEFNNYLAVLDTLRLLNQQLRARKLTLQAASTGYAVYEGLTDLGIDPAYLKEQIEVFERVSPPDFPADQFAKAARSMIKLESETGMSYHQLEVRAVQLKSEITRDENTRRDLANSISSLTAAREELSVP